MKLTRGASDVDPAAGEPCTGSTDESITVGCCWAIAVDGWVRSKAGGTAARAGTVVSATGTG